MLEAVRMYQIINILALLLPIFCNLFKKKMQNNKWFYFGIARWVYYSCGIGVSILTLGIIAIIKEENRSTEHIAISWLFLTYCIMANCIMVVQRVWKIKYNDEIVVFRNSFGIVREYNINDLHLLDNDRLCKVLCNGKTIIQWDTLIMNTIEEVNFCRTISKVPRL